MITLCELIILFLFVEVKKKCYGSMYLINLKYLFSRLKPKTCLCAPFSLH